MSQLSENTTALQTLLETVNALPDYDGDIECTSVSATGDINAGGNMHANVVYATRGTFSFVYANSALHAGRATFAGEVSADGGIAGVTNYTEGVEELTGGKWIDGKPIYRYLWKGTTTHSGSQKVMTNFPGNITPETVITLRGMIQRSDGEWVSAPTSYYGSLNHSANLRTYNGYQIYLGLGSGFDGTKTVVIIVEYTKSTD